MSEQFSGRGVLQKILGNTAWLVLDKVVRLGIGMVVTVWAARHLGPEHFGTLNFSQAIVWMLGTVAGLGLENIVVRDLVRTERDRKTILASAVMLRLIASTLGVIVSVVAVVLVRPGDTQALILVAVLAVALWPQALDVVDHHYQADVNSRPIVVIRNVSFLVFCAVRLLILFFTDSLLLFALTFPLEALVVATLMVWRLVHDRGGFRLPDATLACCKSLISQSWPLVVAGVSLVIYMRIDQLMLGQLKGDAVVGVLSAAVRISEAWYLVPIAIMSSVAPMLAETYQRSVAEYRRQLVRIGRILTWAAVVVAVGMTVLARTVISILYGPEYEGSATILAIHAWGGVFVCLGLVGSNWLLNVGWLRFAMYQTAAGAVINVVLNIFLIPPYGAVGASFATLASYSVASLLIHACFRRTRELFLLQLSLFGFRAA